MVLGPICCGLVFGNLRVGPLRAATKTDLTNESHVV